MADVELDDRLALKGSIIKTAYEAEADTNAFTDADVAALGTALQNVVEDTTPQLGGNLDVQARTITTSTVDGGITLSPNGTGNVTLGTLVLNADATIGAGQDNHVLTYDHAAATWGPEAAPSGGLANVVEDTTPQLGGALDGQGNDLNNLGVAFLTEQAAAEADVAGKGQLWVKTATPNELWFTDDAGTDLQLGAGGDVATDVIWDVAGDIVQGTGANTAARLALGTANQLLRVNAGATALEYYTASGGAGDFLADGSVDMTGEFRTDVGTFDSDVANGAAANAYVLNTAATYSTAGANLLQIQNNGTAVFDFSFDGGIDHKNSGASTAAHSESLNLNWAAATTQTSSGLYSCVIGNNNTASSTASVAIGSSNNVTSASGYGYAIGNSNVVSGQSICFAIGVHHVVDQYYALALGNRARPPRSTLAFAAGSFASQGDAQSVHTVLRAATTDATPTTLQNEFGAINLIIPADTTWAFSALIAARSDEADGNNSAVYKLEGCLKRDESNNTAIVGSVTKTVIAEDTDAVPWDVTAEADDVNEALAIKVTGEAATNIRWVAKVDIAQVTYA